MPLPTPNPGKETANEYVSRCVSFIFHEGTLHGKHMDPKNANDRKRATAACYSTWRSSKKSDDEILKCIRCGLKDSTGHFCRYGKDGEKFYYDINDADSKQLAKSKAEEFGMDSVVTEILMSQQKEEEEKQVDVPPIKPSGNTAPSEERPGDEVIESYIVPKSKDELREGHVVRFNNKVAVIKKKL